MLKKRRRRRVFRRRKKSPETIFWTGLLILVVVAATGLWLRLNLQFPGEVANRDMVLSAYVEAQEPTPSAPAWEPKVPGTHTNILLLGLDDHGMGDVIMVFSYDMESYESALIAIKRDTYVPGQGWAPKGLGQDHLAWSFYRGMGDSLDYHGGAQLTALTVEDLLGIDLHAYAAVTFQGFVELIDAIGGVWVPVAPEFSVREGGALPTGTQRLDGHQALIYARHRRNPRIPEPGSNSPDGDRVRRNQELIKAIMDQGRNLEKEEIALIFESTTENLYTNLDTWDILALVNIFYHRDPAEITTVVLPGEGATVYQDHLEHEVYYYYLDFVESDRILGELGLR